MAFSKMEGGKKPLHRVLSFAISLVYYLSIRVNLFNTVYPYILPGEKNKNDNSLPLNVPWDEVVTIGVLYWNDMV